MLLQELTGIKAFKGKTAGSILYYLRKECGITINHGGYGVVLSHPSWDHVLKLFAKDDCYLHFINYCLETHNKHLPKFIKKPMTLSVFFKNSLGLDIVNVNNVSKEFKKLDKIYAVKIEKLDSMKPGTESYLAASELSDREFYEEYKDLTGTSKALKFLQKHKSGVDLSLYIELADLIVELRDNASSNCFMDLHSGNFMLRGNTLVVTDPYGAKTDQDGMEILKIFDSSELIDLTGERNEEVSRLIAQNIADNFGNKTVELDPKAVELIKARAKKQQQAVTAPMTTAPMRK